MIGLTMLHSVDTLYSRRLCVAYPCLLEAHSCSAVVLSRSFPYRHTCVHIVMQRVDQCSQAAVLWLLIVKPPNSHVETVQCHVANLLCHIDCKAVQDTTFPNTTMLSVQVCGGGYAAHYKRALSVSTFDMCACTWCVLAYCR